MHGCLAARAVPASELPVEGDDGVECLCGDVREATATGTTQIPKYISQVRPQRRTNLQRPGYLSPRFWRKAGTAFVCSSGVESSSRSRLRRSSPQPWG